MRESQLLCVRGPLTLTRTHTHTHPLVQPFVTVCSVGPHFGDVTLWKTYDAVSESDELPLVLLPPDEVLLDQ